MAKELDILKNENAAISTQISQIRGQYETALQKVRDASTALGNMPAQYGANATDLQNIIDTDANADVVALAQSQLVEFNALATEFQRLKTKIDSYVAAIDSVSV